MRYAITMSLLFITLVSMVFGMAIGFSYLVCPDMTCNPAKFEADLRNQIDHIGDLNYLLDNVFEKGG